MNAIFRKIFITKRKKELTKAYLELAEDFADIAEDFADIADKYIKGDYLDGAVKALQISLEYWTKLD